MSQKSGIGASGFDVTAAVLLTDDQKKFVKRVALEEFGLSHMPPYFRLLIEKYLRKEKNYPYWWNDDGNEYIR